MKGVFVFSEIIDAVFIDVDEAFKSHIEQKAVESGLSAVSDEASNAENTRTSSSDLDPNIVVQLFSPLILSQKFMIDQVNNPYSAVHLENNLLFVFQQFGDQVYLAVNGDGLETEAFLHRKLNVLQRILGFLYGPMADECIQGKTHSETADRWRFLSELLHTWCHLAENQQSYLVEAVEQLNVNQGLNTCCIQLLESAISRFRAAGDKLALHAMLIVNSKRLALYSSRSAQEITSSDTLLLILLAKQQFPNSERLEDLFSTAFRPQSPKRKKPSFSTPLQTRTDQDTYHSLTSEESSTSTDDLEQYFSSHSASGDTPEPQPSPRNPENENDNQRQNSQPTRKPLEQLDNCETSLDRNWHLRHMRNWRGAESRSSSESLNMEPKDHMHLNVCLQTPACVFTQHTLHCIEVMPSITLVVISEGKRTKITNWISQAIIVIRKITIHNQFDVGIGRHYYEVIDGCIRRLKDETKKNRGTLERLRDIIKQYEQAKSAGLLDYLEKEQRPKLSESGLENCLGNLADRLKELYHYFFVPSTNPDEYLLDAIGSVREQCTRNLRDYKDFLAVKSQRDFTITSYVEEFPGLVHFIYVNRSNDQMVAPSINIASDETGKVDISQILKDKIWHMVRSAQDQLALGSTSMMVKEGDFKFSYYLWFQDPNTGFPVKIAKPYLGTSTLMPGIICGHFYRHMYHHCFPSVQIPSALYKSIRCTELICVHLSVLPSHVILAQMKQLATKLWNVNGEISPSISLL